MWSERNVRRRSPEPGAEDVTVMDRVYPAGGSTVVGPGPPACLSPSRQTYLVPLDARPIAGWASSARPSGTSKVMTPRAERRRRSGNGGLAPAGWRGRDVERSTHRMAFGAAALVALLLTLAALALPSAAHAAYAPWAPQTSGTTQTLYGVWFADENAGWAVGGGGTILPHAPTAATTWNAQTSRTTQSLNAVAFADAAAGWAVGGGGTILRTTNGGATWTAQKSGTTQSLYAVAFAERHDRLGRGRPRHRAAHDQRRRHLDRPAVRRERRALRRRLRRRLHRLGRSATRAPCDARPTAAPPGPSSPPAPRRRLNAVGCSGASTAWIAGNGGLCARPPTAAPGSRRPPGRARRCARVTVIDASRVRVAGSSGTVRVTVNGGSSWATEATGTTQTLYGIAWRGARGWLVGGGGTILAYAPTRALRPPPPPASRPTTTAAGPTRP